MERKGRKRMKECPRCLGLGYVIIRGKVLRCERIVCPKCGGKGFLDESPFKRDKDVLDG